jgi:hypothetical protein
MLRIGCTAIGRFSRRACRLQHRGNRFQHDKRVRRAVSLAFLKIRARLAHGIGDVSKTQHGRATRAGKGVERRRFHLDGKNALRTCRFDGLGCLAKRRICGPARADIGVQPGLLECINRCRDMARIGFGERGRRCVVVAGAFVSVRGRSLQNRAGHRPAGSVRPR